MASESKSFEEYMTEELRYQSYQIELSRYSISDFLSLPRDQWPTPNETCESFLLRQPVVAQRMKELGLDNIRLRPYCGPHYIFGNDNYPPRAVEEKVYEEYMAGENRYQTYIIELSRYSITDFLSLPRNQWPTLNESWESFLLRQPVVAQRMKELGFDNIPLRRRNVGDYVAVPSKEPEAALQTQFEEMRLSDNQGRIRALQMEELKATPHQT